MNNNQVETSIGLSKFFSKVYGMLGLGIAISGITSFLSLTVFQEQFINLFFNGGRFAFFGIWIAQIALVVYLGKSAFANTNTSKSIVGYIAYAMLTGLTLTVTLVMYSGPAIVQAFVTASIMFITMSVVGTVVKKDLSAMGHAMFSFLIGAIIAIVLNVFFLKSSAVDLFISLALVVIFAGLTAYDNQKIKVFYQQYGEQAGMGLVVYCALTLYLDLVNLFLALVRIFGRD